MPNSLVPTDQETPSEVLIAESLLPYMLGDGKKSAYLSYRVCGFAIREAQRLAGVTQRTVLRWRKADPEFKALDTHKLPAVRKQLGADFTQMEFLRNFRLLLKKDFDIIWKFAMGKVLSKAEMAYLKGMRKLYTPQQLEVLKRVLSGGGAPQSFTFTQFVVKLAQERQEQTGEVFDADFKEVKDG